MLPDDELCLCFHVTQRKVQNFLRVERPRVASQMSECFGAGTGCGWCRPFLLRLWEAHQAAIKGATQGNNPLPRLFRRPTYPTPRRMPENGQPTSKRAEARRHRGDAGRVREQNLGAKSWKFRGRSGVFF